MIEDLSGFPSRELLENSNGVFYLIPLGVIYNYNSENLVKNKLALPLVNKRFSFCSVKLVINSSNKYYSFFSSVGDMFKWLEGEDCLIKNEIYSIFNNLNNSPNTYCGLKIDKPLIMGILNVTPDSFSDGGRYNDFDSAVRHSQNLIDAGASIIDVGGESTRPGAIPVDPSVEQERIIPIVKVLSEKGITVSVDTMHASTMDLALNSGASIINDISALSNDKDSVQVIKKNKAFVIMMHMQGKPLSMQESPSYGFAEIDVYNFLKSRIEFCQKEGVSRDKISIDPGIGFGKSQSHNFNILKNIMLFQMLGLPLVLGVSRKSFVGNLTGVSSPDNRLIGSVSLGLINAIKGVNILRVHDVIETNEALKVIDVF